MAGKTRTETEKLSITLPAELAAELRVVAGKGKISHFIAEAAKIHLARYKQRKGLQAGYGAWKAEDHPELLTPQETAQYIERLRKLDERRICKEDG